MKDFIKKYWIVILGVVLGAIGGWLYWYFVGCENGCPIKSSPVNSTLAWALLGGLIFSIFIPKQKKEDKE